MIFLIQNQRPAGKVQTRMWRSKKKETHVVGWCSDTEAMMGMWILAYLGIESEEKRGRERRQTACNSCRVERVGNVETNYTLDPPD